MLILSIIKNDVHDGMPSNRRAPAIAKSLTTNYEGTYLRFRMRHLIKMKLRMCRKSYDMKELVGECAQAQTK